MCLLCTSQMDSNTAGQSPGQQSLLGTVDITSSQSNGQQGLPNTVSIMPSNQTASSQNFLGAVSGPNVGQCQFTTVNRDTSTFGLFSEVSDIDKLGTTNGEVSVECNLAQYQGIRQVLGHIQICQAGQECTVPNCAPSKALILHWENCTLKDCTLCFSLKLANVLRQEQIHVVQVSQVNQVPNLSVVQKVYASLGLPFPTSNSGVMDSGVQRQDLTRSLKKERPFPSPSQIANHIQLPQACQLQANVPLQTMLQNNASVANTTTQLACMGDCLQPSVKTTSATLMNSLPNQILPLLSSVTCTRAPTSVKEWHEAVTADLRHHLIQRIMREVLVVLNKKDLNDPNDPIFLKVINYARRSESIMYDVADTREEYYHLLAKKIFKIQRRELFDGHLHRQVATDFGTSGPVTSQQQTNVQLQNNASVANTTSATLMKPLPNQMSERNPEALRPQVATGLGTAGAVTPQQQTNVQLQTMLQSNVSVANTNPTTQLFMSDSLQPPIKTTSTILMNSLPNQMSERNPESQKPQVATGLGPADAVTPQQQTNEQLRIMQQNNASVANTTSATLMNSLPNQMSECNREAQRPQVATGLGTAGAVTPQQQTNVQLQTMLQNNVSVANTNPTTQLFMSDSLQPPVKTISAILMNSLPNQMSDRNPESQKPQVATGLGTADAVTPQQQTNEQLPIMLQNNVSVANTTSATLMNSLPNQMSESNPEAQRPQVAIGLGTAGAVTLQQQTNEQLRIMLQNNVSVANMNPTTQLFMSDSLQPPDKTTSATLMNSRPNLMSKHSPEAQISEVATELGIAGALTSQQQSIEQLQTMLQNNKSVANPTTQFLFMGDSLQPSVKTTSATLLNSLPSQTSPLVSNVTGTCAPTSMKEWRQTVTTDLRYHMIQKIIHEILVDFNKKDLNDINYPIFLKVIHYARRNESIMYDSADTREEYYQLLAEKIFKIRKRVLSFFLQREPEAQMPHVATGFGTAVPVSSNPRLPRTASLSQLNLVTANVSAAKQKMPPPNVTVLPKGETTTRESELFPSESQLSVSLNNSLTINENQLNQSQVRHKLILNDLELHQYHQQHMNNISTVNYNWDTICEFIENVFLFCVSLCYIIYFLTK